jgi:hypothetical protein
VRGVVDVVELLAVAEMLLMAGLQRACVAHIKSRVAVAGEAEFAKIKKGLNREGTETTTTWQELRQEAEGKDRNPVSMRKLRKMAEKQFVPLQDSRYESHGPEKEEP